MALNHGGTICWFSIAVSVAVKSSIFVQFGHFRGAVALYDVAPTYLGLEVLYFHVLTSLRTYFSFRRNLNTGHESLQIIIFGVDRVNNWGISGSPAASGNKGL